MNTNHKNISQYAEQLPEAVVTHRETPQQMVDRIVQQVLEQLMNMPESVKKVIDIPEVVKIMKEVLEKLQLVEVNLD